MAIEQQAGNMAKALGLGDKDTNTVLPDLIFDPPVHADTLLLTMLTALTGTLTTVDPRYVYCVDH